ncbi:hypothetical protein DITRI_Ditri02bG0160100 [Diplodiscus trichospermus]
MASTLSGKLETEIQIKAAAHHFHDIFCNKTHQISTTSSDKIGHCRLHEGDWGTVGSVVDWSYIQDDGEVTKAKKMVESINWENKSITFKVTEGDILNEYKYFKMTIKATPKSDGEGSVVNWTMEYERMHEGVTHPEALLNLATKVSKDVDAHLTQGN